MSISYETLTVFIFLIPGFITSIMLNTFVVRKEKENLAKIIEALIFSFIIYTIIAIFIHESPISLIAEKVGDTTQYSIEYNAKVVGGILALSIGFALLGGYLATNDSHMKLFRKWRITAKTARDTVWLDVFTEQKRHVIANLKSGRRVYGWPMYYSNTPDEGMLYLWDPAWITEDRKYLELNIHGLFLTGEEIDSIEFMNYHPTNSNKENEAQNGK